MGSPGSTVIAARQPSLTPEIKMHAAPMWNVDPTKVLTRRELATVLADAKCQAERSANARRNSIIVRLSCCCGLRVSEIAGLEMDDVLVDVARPHLRLRRETTKGKRARMVPLWWDAGTLADLTAWKAERTQQGAKGRDPFVCSVQAHLLGQPLQRHAIRRRFLSACKVLGLTRLGTLTIHHGRHTYISHALAGGRTLAEVRAAAGHSNVAITSAYLHIIVDDEDVVGNLFAAR
jgi:integrase